LDTAPNPPLIVLFEVQFPANHSGCDLLNCPNPGITAQVRLQGFNFGLGDFLTLVIAQIEEPNRDPERFNCRLVHQQKSCSLDTPSLPLQVVQLNRGAVCHQAIPVLTESHLAKELGSINVAGLRARVLFFFMCKTVGLVPPFGDKRLFQVHSKTELLLRGPKLASDISATNCSEQRPDRHTCHPCPPGRAKQRYARDSLNGVAGWKEFEAEFTLSGGSPEIRRLRAWQT